MAQPGNQDNFNITSRQRFSSEYNVTESFCEEEETVKMRRQLNSSFGQEFHVFSCGGH